MATSLHSLPKVPSKGPDKADNKAKTARVIMRRTLLLIALGVLPVVLPVTARTATPSDCSLYIGAFAKDLATNTTTIDELAQPYSPTPDHVAQSAARYARDVDYSKLCTDFKKPYVDALLTTWRAWLEHSTNHEDPIVTIELAARQLEKCAAAYSGTQDGTTCADWKKQVATWQTEWSAP